jgi:hypothetical protein
MLTEPGAERKAFKEQESMCQHVRDYTKIKARREVIRRHKAQFLDGVPQEQFEHLLADSEKDADEIAREAQRKLVAISPGLSLAWQRMRWPISKPTPMLCPR